MTAFPDEGLTAAHSLSQMQVSQLRALLHLIESDEHAPTAVRGAERAVDIHIADSLTALDLDRVRSAPSIADLGSGSGFPGLAIAVALPDAEVALIESQRRKCDFLERACAHAKIENALVVWTRVEEWSEGLGRNDVVVARALAAQPVVLEYAAPLLRMGGSLVDWRGRRDPAQETEAVCAAEQLGMRMLEIRHTEPYRGARDHHLHVFEKVAETASRFPRRAGVARKRPLGC
ncbi:MAG TPA: 16S rRNA (guanine(527)-N(7))-methyltransferase RsmG [Solirubrobacteraceae bacterium]|jgi:16S rRNA (guanine527-N7)-methyltransferase|nr:16S rRNA (guanine(527)-N(7))-methyltransferase RsmG [Solirubrobacteraceae bacterium]